MSKPRKLTIACIVIVLVVVSVVILLKTHRVLTPGNETEQKTANQVASFDKQRYSTSSPSSLWVVVNKQRPLPSDYEPSDLKTPDVPLRGSGTEMLVRDQAASSLESMFKAAKKSGVNLMLVSGYRSFALQQSVYNRYVSEDGEAAANQSSAKPGYSEHQTGLAVDLGGTDRACELQECFGSTPAGTWIRDNAHSYGFIVRYQKGKEAITGYLYEPWHLRYVGKSLAKEIQQTGQTLEEFFGLPAAPDYN